MQGNYSSWRHQWAPAISLAVSNQNLLTSYSPTLEPMGPIHLAWFLLRLFVEFTVFFPRYPLVNKQLDPEHSLVLLETNLNQPLYICQGRTVNLPAIQVEIPAIPVEFTVVSIAAAPG